MNEKWQQLKEWIGGSDNIVFFGGAGVSKMCIRDRQDGYQGNTHYGKTGSCHGRFCIHFNLQEILEQVLGYA